MHSVHEYHTSAFTRTLPHKLTHTHTCEHIHQWIVWAVILMATIAFMPEVRAFFRGAFAAVSGLLGSLACLALGQHTHTDDLPVYLVVYANFRWRMKSVSRQPGDRATFAMCKQERRKWKTSRDIAHVGNCRCRGAFLFMVCHKISSPTAKYSNLNS